jgi:type VI secretion system secreted protein Hcp
MATDAYIKFDGVDGESTSADHRCEIEVVSWNWGLTAAQAPSGGGSGAGRATPGAFVFSHFYDKASPALGKKAASGTHFATVVLSVRRTGQGQKDFLNVTMKDVVVTAIAVSGVAADGIVETVSLAYRKIEFGYKPQQSNGSLGAAVKFGWDTKTGTVT